MATLNEILEGLPGDAKVRIGTQNGAGFLYIGTVGGYNDRKVSADTRDAIEARLHAYIARLVPGSVNLDRNHATAEKALRRLAEFEPIGDREVVEIYDGEYEPDSAVIIVKGNESGKTYNPKLPPLSADTITKDSLEALVFEIYKTPARRLVNDYFEYYKKELTGTEEAIERYREIIDAEVQAILATPYQSREVNESIVRRCEIEGRRLFEEWRGK